jgi:signal transduction histidine kinase
VLDRTGQIISVNEAWREFARSNGDPDTSIGPGVNYLEVCRSVQGEDRHHAQQACRGIEDVFAGRRTAFQLEYPCHSPTQQRWFLLYVSRLNTDQDFVVTTHLSITDRKLTELRLVESERLAAIGEAMRGLSHEGRNALQRAQASIELLELELQDNVDALGVLQRIATAHSHLLGLYEEVTRYASPIHPQTRPYPLDLLVEEAWSQVAQPEAEFSQVATELDLTCDIDPDAMRTVLGEVFKNAVSSSPGATRIQVSYRESTLDRCPGITMVVSDNGTGIAQEDWERAFEPFFTTRPSGTGLGLAIARRVVASQHGRIYFGQPLQAGASVYLSLPARRSH